MFCFIVIPNPFTTRPSRVIKTGTNQHLPSEKDGIGSCKLGHLSIALPKIPFCRFSPLLITDASADVSVLKSVFARLVPRWTQAS